MHVLACVLACVSLFTEVTRSHRVAVQRTENLVLALFMVIFRHIGGAPPLHKL